MKKLALATFCLFYSCSINAIDAQKLFTTLRTKILSVNDYAANIKIKINVNFMKTPELKGMLYFKSPDKMKLERHGGISLLPKKNVNITLNNLIPNGNVTVIDAGTETKDGTNLRIIKVIPDSDSGEIVLTKLWIDEQKMIATHSETTTKNDGTIQLDLEYNRYLKYSLPDKLTIHLDLKDFQLPKGVTMDYDNNSGEKQPVKVKSKKGTITISYLNYEINKGLSDSLFGK